MNRCPISDEIAAHCNEEEAFCPKCGGNMYYDDGEHDILKCIECHHKEDVTGEQELNFDD